MGLVVSWCSWLHGQIWLRCVGDYHELYQWVCNHGNAQDVRLLLGDPLADPNAGYQRPVEWAIRRGNTEVLRELLSCDRVSPKANEYALEEALYENRPDYIRVLLADPRYNNRKRTQCTFGLRVFLKIEYAQLASVMCWLGTQIGCGWKDLICDIFVRYTGVLYETRSRRRRRR